MTGYVYYENLLRLRPLIYFVALLSWIYQSEVMPLNKS